MESLQADYTQSGLHTEIFAPDFTPVIEQQAAVSIIEEITPDLFENPPQEIRIRYSYIHAPHANNATVADRQGFRPRLIELYNGQILIFDSNLPPIVELDNNSSELVISNWYELVAQNVVNLDATAELRRNVVNEWAQIPISHETNIALTKNKALIRIPLSPNLEIIPARTYAHEVHIAFDRVTKQCFVIPRLSRQTFRKQGDELVVETDLGGKDSEERMLYLQEGISLRHVLSELTLAQLEQMAYGKQQPEA